MDNFMMLWSVTNHSLDLLNSIFGIFDNIFHNPLWFWSLNRFKNLIIATITWPGHVSKGKNVMWAIIVCLKKLQSMSCRCDPKWITLPPCKSRSTVLNLDIEKKKINSRFGLNRKLGKSQQQQHHAYAHESELCKSCPCLFLFCFFQTFRLRQGTNSIHIATSI